MKTSAEMQKREAVRSLHGKAAVTVSREEKLKKLITWRHWRQAGYTVPQLKKRLRTSHETVKRWAAELGFDLGGKRDAWATGGGKRDACATGVGKRDACATDTKGGRN